MPLMAHWQHVARCRTEGHQQSLNTSAMTNNIFQTGHAHLNLRGWLTETINCSNSVFTQLWKKVKGKLHNEGLSARLHAG